MLPVQTSRLFSSFGLADTPICWRSSPEQTQDGGAGISSQYTSLDVLTSWVERTPFDISQFLETRTGQLYNDSRQPERSACCSLSHAKECTFVRRLVAILSGRSSGCKTSCDALSCVHPLICEDPLFDVRMQIYQYRCSEDYGYILRQIMLRDIHPTSANKRITKPYTA